VPLLAGDVHQQVHHDLAGERVQRSGRLVGEQHGRLQLVAALCCLYRRAVPDSRLAQINEVAAATGNDPDLDTLLLRLHTDTACRRGGALALRLADLDPEQCLVLLREKGETTRWQPVSPTLMDRLVRHGQERQAPSDSPLPRYADGRPITYRRYDYLWARIGGQPSAAYCVQLPCCQRQRHQCEQRAGAVVAGQPDRTLLVRPCQALSGCGQSVSS
jgi:hypothetical protein